MSRGDGSVVKRSGGWQIRYYVKGKEIRESVSGIVGKSPRECTEVDAREALRSRRDLRLSVAEQIGERIKRTALGVGHSPNDWLVTQAVAGLLIGPTPTIIRSQELKALTGSIVYAYFRAGRALYVGQSTIGIARPIAPGHQHLGVLIHDAEPLAVDHLVVWPTSSERDARELETQLIRALKPSLNRARRQSLNGHIAPNVGDATTPKPA